MNELKDKITLITGGGSGIGAAAAMLFAMEGAKAVVIADVNEQAASGVVSEIKEKAGVECSFVKTDVSKEEEVKKLFAFVKDRYGTLDALVNSAGVCRTIPLMESTVKDWREQIAINLEGTLFCAKEAFAIMLPKKYGKIVNISSVSGRTGGIRTSPGYVASKGAILSLTKSLAKEAAPAGVNVNGVAPGVIITEMTKTHKYFPSEIPMVRKGTAEEVANVILFLASDRASYLAGVTIDVNGGSYMN
jgi:3-oxoacyl-[acyl-carrier protein] reductase